MGKKTYLKVSSVWTAIKDVFFKVSGTWRTVNKIYLKVGGTWREVFTKTITLTISANTNDYNIFTEAGSPTSPVNVEVTINGGVTVGATSTSNAAIDTGTLPAGSYVTITNNGDIIGAGGAGGQPDGLVSSGSNCPSDGSAQNGGDGGDAINAQLDITIDNTSGNIFGGGGGGGGGGIATFIRLATDIDICCGGGGGGGAGNNGGGGGLPSQHTSCTNITFYDGTSGSSGSTVGGAGGSGGCGPSNCGADGSDGGGYGENGIDGNAASSGSVGGETLGGAAGKAVELNGNSITWLGGNNPTQVKGAAS